MTSSTDHSSATRCPYCGGGSRFFCTNTDRLHHTTDRVFTYDQCTTCRAVLMRDLPSMADIQTFYPQQYVAYQPVTDQRSWFALRALPRTGHAVEIGCGPGNALAAFARFRPNWTLTGVDFSPESIEAARQRLPKASFSHGDLMAWLAQAPAASYDLVICEHVIEHVQKPQSLFQHLNRIRKPHGVILLSIPNADSITMRLFRERAFHLETPRHLYIPSHHSILRLVASEHLHIQSAEGQAYPSVLLRSGGRTFQRLCQWTMRVRIIGIITRALSLFRHRVPSFFSKMTYVIVEE